MTTHEERMCELQADFFELSVSRFLCSSSYFIFRFMTSESAKNLDRIDDPYNYTSPNNLISEMKRNYPSLDFKEGTKYPKSVMRWIGYIYRAWSIIKEKESNRIYSEINADKMLSLYDVYHTFSAEYCIGKLEEIVNENKNKKSDYEIFKEIYEK